MSKALKKNETTHENFTLIMNREKKYYKLKESIRIVKLQRKDIEKIN